MLLKLWSTPCTKYPFFNKRIFYWNSTRIYILLRCVIKLKICSTKNIVRKINFVLPTNFLAKFKKRFYWPSSYERTFLLIKLYNNHSQDIVWIHILYDKARRTYWLADALTCTNTWARTVLSLNGWKTNRSCERGRRPRLGWHSKRAGVSPTLLI